MNTSSLLTLQVIVKRLHIALVMLLSAVWLGGMLSRGVEPVTWLLADYACPASTDSGSPREGCSHDEVAQVTERRYNPSRKITILRPSSQQPAVCAEVTDRLSLAEAPVRLTAHTWQFHERAALLPRAPSSLL